MSGRAWDPDLLSGPGVGTGPTTGTTVARTGSGGSVRQAGWTTDFSNAK